MMRLPHDDISRRSFLKSAATAAGGLVIAVYLPACSKPEQAAPRSSPMSDASNQRRRRQFMSQVWLNPA